MGRFSLLSENREQSATGSEFGEAHFIAVSPKGEIYIADSVNRSVQKFVKK